MAGILGLEIVFAAKNPENYTPLGLQDPDPFQMFNKDKAMVVLKQQTVEYEAVAHLLNDRITPNKYMFIRNNGLVPENINVNEWTITLMVNR